MTKTPKRRTSPRHVSTKETVAKVTKSVKAPTPAAKAAVKKEAPAASSEGTGSRPKRGRLSAKVLADRTVKAAAGWELCFKALKKYKE